MGKNRISSLIVIVIYVTTAYACATAIPREDKVIIISRISNEREISSLIDNKKELFRIREELFREELFREELYRMRNEAMAGDACTKFHEASVPQMIAASPRPDIMGLETAYVKPREHLWSNFEDIDSVADGYSMYTYVLINRNNSDILAWDKFVHLTALIRQTTSPVGDHDVLFKPWLSNLFLIPYKNETLNDKLFMSLLAGLAAAEKNQELSSIDISNPGPFLISVVKPIRSDNNYWLADVLYVDLTYFNLNAFPEVVAAYKKRIVNKSVSGYEHYKSIRLALLNFMLNADEYIRIIKVAYAGLKD